MAHILVLRSAILCLIVKNSFSLCPPLPLNFSFFFFTCAFVRLVTFVNTLGPVFIDKVNSYLDPANPIYLKLGVVAFKAIIRLSMLCRSVTDDGGGRIVEFWRNRSKLNKDVIVHCLKSILYLIQNSTTVQTELLECISEYIGSYTHTDSSSLQSELLNSLTSFVPHSSLADAVLIRNFEKYSRTHHTFKSYMGDNIYIMSDEVARAYFSYVVHPLLQKSHDMLDPVCFGTRMGPLIKSMKNWYSMSPPESEMSREIQNILYEFAKNTLIPIKDGDEIHKVVALAYESLITIEKHLEHISATSLYYKSRLLEDIVRWIRQVNDNTYGEEVLPPDTVILGDPSTGVESCSNLRKVIILLQNKIFDKAQLEATFDMQNLLVLKSQFEVGAEAFRRLIESIS